MEALDIKKLITDELEVTKAAVLKVADDNSKAEIKKMNDLVEQKFSALNQLPPDVKPEDVTKEQRTIGKSIRHATNYSGGPAVVQKKLQIPLREAKSYLSRFTSITPQLAVWHGKLREKLQEDRTLITPLGRKRIFMDRWGDQLFRSAYAFIPQSTIGDLLNISFVDFYNKHKDSYCSIISKKVVDYYIKKTK